MIMEDHPKPSVTSATCFPYLVERAQTEVTELQRESRLIGCPRAKKIETVTGY